MKWFGPSWGAPVNESCEQTTPPPPEARCGYCELPFVEGAQGLELPYASVREGPLTIAYHKNCLFAAIGLEVTHDS